MHGEVVLWLPGAMAGTELWQIPVLKFHPSGPQNGTGFEESSHEFK